MNKFLLSCLLLSLVPSVSFSQTSRKIEFRTLCLEQVKGLETVKLFTGDDEDNPEVTLYTDVSPSIAGVFKTKQAVFCVESAGADGKVERTVVGKATLGKSSRQLFLFIPSGGGKGKPAYHVKAYDDDLRSFAMGNIRAINLAPVPVRFILSGASTPQIPPGKFARFPHSTKVDEYKMYSVITEFMSANGEWVKGQSTSWKASKRRREIVITLVDAKYKLPVVRMFTDFPVWADQ